jgi:hypothetical protein
MIVFALGFFSGNFQEVTESLLLVGECYTPRNHQNHLTERKYDSKCEENIKKQKQGEVPTLIFPILYPIPVVSYILRS